MVAGTDDLTTRSGGRRRKSAKARSRGQPDRVRRVAVLMGISETDLDSGAQVTAFQQTLQTLGWTPGRNLWIDYRWGAGNIEKVRAAVTELLGIRPDVIVADGMPALRAFHQTSTNLPIVFTIVSEPVAAGFVESLAHPGGNITGPLVDQVIGLLLAALHGIESGIWAAAYLWLGALNSALDALLFSVNSMTTRGASGLTLPSHWQMMGALEAADGMLLFGVSTAFVFAVIETYWSMIAVRVTPGKT